MNEPITIKTHLAYETQGVDEGRFTTLDGKDYLVKNGVIRRLTPKKKSKRTKGKAKE